MVDEPSTLKTELIYWPATTFAARAEEQAALFRYIDGWQKPRRIQQGLVGRSPDEYEAAWQAGSVNPLGYRPTQGRRKAQVEKKKISHGETGGGVCGHGKMGESVQKSRLLIEQTEEFVSHLFDAGHLTEAKRLAVTLRCSATARPQRILLTIDLSEVSGVSDGGEFIRVRRRVLRPEDGSLPE